MNLQLILDLMGGDKAPQAILEGALKALPELSQARDGRTCELVLLGDEAIIKPLLKKKTLPRDGRRRFLKAKRVRAAQ